MVVTEAGEEKIFTYTSMSLLAVLAVGTIVLNSFCVDVIRRSRSLLRKPSNIFILNLLVIQLLQSIAVLPLYILQKSNLMSGQWRMRVCNSFRFTYTLAFFGTCVGVLLTSIDRFFAVFWITSYRIRFTRRRVLLTLFCTWIYLLSLCTIPLFSDTVDIHMTIKCDGKNVDTYCDYHPSKLWTILMLLINTVLPYLIVIVLYVYVVRTVKYFEKKAHDRTSKYFEISLKQKNSPTIKVKQKDFTKHKKITKLTIVLCLVYAFLWLPSILFYAVKHLQPTWFGEKMSCWSEYIDFTVKYIAFLNGIAVPIIYCFYQKEFRRSAGQWNSARSSLSDTEKMKLLSEEML